MKYSYPVKKRGLLFTLLILFITSSHSFAQLIYQPYSYQFYQKLNKDVYSPATSLHTSLKPYFITDSSSIRTSYDSLMQNNVDNSQKSWLNHVLFSGHVVEVKNKEFTFYMDYLTDLQIGHDFEEKRNTNLNTRGYEVGGTIGSNFFFYTTGFENQGKFASYYENYIIAGGGIVPGQAYDRIAKGDSRVPSGRDWSYSTAMVGFMPNKNMSVALGVDKTFIGDGYRSVLLSDFAPNYPLLRFTANLGKHVQYMAMWTYMDNQEAVRFDVNPSGSNYRRTWGAFHYIDWNINNRASLGFFNALIAAEAEDDGTRHGFDVNYINPVLFLRSLGPSNRTPDHTLIGFNGKYKVLDKTTVYGQLLFDQASTANTGSRTAYQLGFRGADLLKVNSLNYLFEFNTAAPYTYSNQYPVVNYSQLSGSLTHPLGANYREWLGIMNYSLGKFDFQGQLNYARYGLNTTTVNYGKDITKADNVALPPGNISTGQGLATSLKYAEGTVSFMLNPKYNLHLEVGGLLRQETNAVTDTKTAMITFGLRSSFRNLYHDF